MGATLVSMALALAFNSQGGRILPPGPGDGWGFPNGNPDGYGWADYGYCLPVCDGRTPSYHFPRHFALPPEQSFLSTYYNPYAMRGQRYIPYNGCGGCHPASVPLVPTITPVHPYETVTGGDPVVPPPSYSGRVEAPPTQSGGSGLIP